MAENSSKYQPRSRLVPRGHLASLIYTKDKFSDVSSNEFTTITTANSNSHSNKNNSHIHSNNSNSNSRSTSAPPIEALYLSKEDLSEQQVDLSLEDPRNNPDYAAFFYNHSRLDPRLPPPLYSPGQSWQLWTPNGSLLNANHWDRDRRKPSFGSITTSPQTLHNFQAQRSSFEESHSLGVGCASSNPNQPNSASKDGVFFHKTKPNGSLYMSSSGSGQYVQNPPNKITTYNAYDDIPSLSQRKKLVDMIQEDFPRTPSPVYGAQSKSIRSIKPISIQGQPASNVTKAASSRIKNLKINTGDDFAVETNHNTIQNNNALDELQVSFQNINIDKASGDFSTSKSSSTESKSPQVNQSDASFEKKPLEYSNESTPDTGPRLSKKHEEELDEPENEDENDDSHLFLPYEALDYVHHQNNKYFTSEEDYAHAHRSLDPHYYRKYEHPPQSHPHHHHHQSYLHQPYVNYHSYYEPSVPSENSHLPQTNYHQRNFVMDYSYHPTQRSGYKENTNFKYPPGGNPDTSAPANALYPNDVHGNLMGGAPNSMGFQLEHQNHLFYYPNANYLHGNSSHYSHSFSSSSLGHQYAPPPSNGGGGSRKPRFSFSPSLSKSMGPNHNNNNRYESYNFFPPYSVDENNYSHPPQHQSPVFSQKRPVNKNFTKGSNNNAHYNGAHTTTNIDNDNNNNNNHGNNSSSSAHSNVPTNSTDSSVYSTISNNSVHSSSFKEKNMEEVSSFPSPLPSLSGGDGFNKNRSAILEDFRNNKNRKFEIKDILEHIVEFSGDQFGSRFIQQKLEAANLEDKYIIFNEILPHSIDLMVDVFGNYVIQKFFELGTSSQKASLAKKMEKHITSLSLQMYGCRVVQKALEHLGVEYQEMIIKELDGHVLRCVKDQNGNHVIQKCIERVPPRLIQFIVNAFKGQIFGLAIHPYGCRVIQRIFEHCSEKQAKPLLDELHRYTYSLVQDQYGNYVIQHILEKGSMEDKRTIVNNIKGHILNLSRHKFASNVIEKCVAYGSREDRQVLIEEIITPRSDGVVALFVMMKDQFANYVIQKMLDVVDLVQKELLVSKIKPQISFLRKYTYGKHIITKVEKIIYSSELDSGFQHQSSSTSTSPSAATGATAAEACYSPSYYSPNDEHVQIGGEHSAEDLLSASGTEDYRRPPTSQEYIY